MFTGFTRTHIGLAIALAMALGASAVSAQGKNGKGTLQPVGTMQIASPAGVSGPIYDFGFSVTNTFTPGGGGGGGTGKASLTAVEVTRLPDAGSPLLFRAAVLGVQLPSVQFTVVGTGKSAPEAMYVLHDAFVSGFTSTDGLERIAFSYKSIEVIVGGTQFCFDLSTNTSC
jgi:hypothetical protein